MLGHEVVLADVDEKVLLAKDFHDGRQDGRNDFERGACWCDLGDENARVVVLFAQQLREVLDVFDSDIALIGKLDVNVSDLCLFLGLVGSCERRVFFDHGCGRSRCKGHFRSLRDSALVGI